MSLKFEDVDEDPDTLLARDERVLRARVRGGWIYHFSHLAPTGMAIATVFVPDPKPTDFVIVPHAPDALPEEVWSGDTLPQGTA